VRTVRAATILRRLPGQVDDTELLEQAKLIEDVPVDRRFATLVPYLVESPPDERLAIHVPLLPLSRDGRWRL